MHRPMFVWQNVVLYIKSVWHSCVLFPNSTHHCVRFVFSFSKLSHYGGYYALLLRQSYSTMNQSNTYINISLFDMKHSSNLCIYDLFMIFTLHACVCLRYHLLHLPLQFCSLKMSVKVLPWGALAVCFARSALLPGVLRCSSQPPVRPRTCMTPSTRYRKSTIKHRNATNCPTAIQTITLITELFVTPRCRGVTMAAQHAPRIDPRPSTSLTTAIRRETSRWSPTTTCLSRWQRRRRPKPRSTRRWTSSSKGTLGGGDTWSSSTPRWRRCRNLAWRETLPSTTSCWTFSPRRFLFPGTSSSECSTTILASRSAACSCWSRWRTMVRDHGTPRNLQSNVPRGEHQRV